MFSRKSNNEVKLDRLKADSPTAEQSPISTLPILRPKSNDRQRIRKDSWCVCSIETKGGEIREGVIIDVSKAGARVRFRSRGPLPKIVRIKASRIGLRRFARVVWQSVFDVGLEFIPDKKIQ